MEEDVKKHGSCGAAEGFRRSARPLIYYFWAGGTHRSVETRKGITSHFYSSQNDLLMSDGIVQF